MNQENLRSKTRLKLYYGRKEWSDEQSRPHRIGGPAIIYDNGMKIWKLHGVYHREDGPAIEFFDGGTQFYLFGEKYNSLEEVLEELSSVTREEYSKKISFLTKIIPIETRSAPKSRNRRIHRENFQPIQIKTVSNFEKTNPEVIKRCK